MMLDALRKEQDAVQRVKCLIVDDLAENLLALAALLEDPAVEVLQARSGREALELLLVHEVALALIDVQMPDMDGFELAELMRGSERTQRVPIIFVTAGARDQQRIFTGYDRGAVDFLFKPIEAHILKSKASVFFQLQRQTLLLERQLEERTETLRLNEMFTAVLGHDLRGPLSAILMSAQLLSSRPDEASQKVGTRLLRSGQWMSRMIEDMLDLTRARIGGGIAVKRQADCDFGELCRRVVQERQSTFPDRVVESLQKGDLKGEWDSDRVVQMASNLVGNALIHGDPKRPVRVELDGSDADQVALRVSNGGRIPPELLPQIFNPFRSGRKGSNRAEGLGLGLFIAQQIARSHQGTIEVRNLPAESTCFEVILPRHRARPSGTGPTIE